MARREYGEIPICTFFANKRTRKYLFIAGFVCKVNWKVQLVFLKYAPYICPRIKVTFHAFLILILHLSQL